MPDNSPVKTGTSAQNRVRQIEFQGVPVLDLDFTQATPQQTLTMLDQFHRTLDGAAPDSLRVLSDVTEMTYDAGVSSKWKAIRMKYDPFIRASAVYGANSFMNVAVLSYTELMTWLRIPRAKTKIRVFKNREQALAWLITT
jgi:hypothetical protein